MTTSTICAIDRIPRRQKFIDTYEYDAYGNEFTVSGGSNTPNEMYYRGEQWDSDLGLLYLRARYYNPLTGRFMSRDPNSGVPWIPPTLHRYLYAGGDPVNMLDPSGREFVEVARILNSSFKAQTFFSAIGCGISIGTTLGVGGLDQAFNQ